MARQGTSEPEWLTRKRRIDPLLAAAGWEVVPHNRFRRLEDHDRCAVEEYPTENGPADYVLIVGGEILGIVEAKKLTIGPQNVLTQAERYSRGLKQSPFNFRGFRVPFLYSTNGEVIWHHDVRHELDRSRRLSRFHTPKALLELQGRDFDGACRLLAATANDHHYLRPYQLRANQQTEEAIAARKRRMLLPMATGTGKTFTIVNQAYRLMKAEVAQRVLFLVDRRALAAQAVRAFASFVPERNLKLNQIYEVYSQRLQRDDFEDDGLDAQLMPESYLVDPKPSLAFVYVCTIQRMTINLFGRGAVFRDRGEPEDEAWRSSRSQSNPLDELEKPCRTVGRGLVRARTACWTCTSVTSPLLVESLQHIPARARWNALSYL